MPARRPRSASPTARRAGRGTVRGAAVDPVEWLLEENQPSVRYLTLTTLLGRATDDPEVVAARASIPRVGWAADILGRMDPGGFWESREKLYLPKYLSTNWMLIILADLGVTRADARIAKAAPLWISRFAAREDGGFGGESGRRSHLCIAGNTARSLIRFGFEDHPRVRGTFDWLLQSQAKLGGWSCWGSGRNLDSWEGLSAFAAYPRSRWTTEMEEAVSKAAEFYLSRHLTQQGDHYEPWYRFHYPVHYYYDILVGLDLLTDLGYGADPRLDPALAVLRAKRGPEGRWPLDALHPDVEGPIAEWFAKHPKQRPTPFGLEPVGGPSKMITLRALRVLRRVEEARRGAAG